MAGNVNLTLENLLNPNKEEYMMYFEKNRERSFQNWPFDDTAACNPKTLAAAGFYHIPSNNEPDAVRCFCCYKELDGWEPEDDPWDEHIKHSSKCHILTLKRPISDPSDFTMEEFIKLECERTANKVTKVMHAKSEEFKAHAAKVKEELKKLGK